RYTLEKSLRNFLALIDSLQQPLVMWIRDETDLGKNRRHSCADQDNEWRLAHTTISRAAIHSHRSSPERGLHFLRELARLVCFGLQYRLVEQVVQIGNGTNRSRILASGEIQRTFVGGEIEVIR